MGIAAMIPVRQGSERLARKNYLTIGELSVCEHAIKKAIASSCFDYILLNSDDPSLEATATRYGINFYLRPNWLASSAATSDQVVLDAFQHIPSDCEYLFWVNTASPLSTTDDIKNVVSQSLRKRAKAIVTVRRTKGHLLYDNKPLNFSLEGGFSKTQDIKHAIEFNYAVMGWRRDAINDLEDGILFGQGTEYLESSVWSNILLKSEEDFRAIKLIASSIAF